MAIRKLENSLKAVNMSIATSPFVQTMEPGML